MENIVGVDGSKAKEEAKLPPEAHSFNVTFVEPGWQEKPDGSLWKNGVMVDPPTTKMIEARPVAATPHIRLVENEPLPPEPQPQQQPPTRGV